ncbi:protein FAM185A-like isoform X1 [Ptychodera flava]|uniref:protein FAM185A-like isoform X1 n=1 Tax=Ptychodera flava TaxID=63121 RepID=UPI00396A268B
MMFGRTFHVFLRSKNLTACLQPLLVAKTATLVRNLAACRRYTPGKRVSNNSAAEPSIKLKSWTFEVYTFGHVLVDSGLNVNVSPVDPIQYPEANMVFVHLVDNASPSQRNATQGISENTPEMCECEVKYDGTNRLTVSANSLQNEDTGTLHVQIEVPIKFNIDANMKKGGKIHVTSIDNDHCKISTDKGECRLTNLKCISLNVDSKCGDVISEKSLHSNGQIKVHGSGSVTADKLYGMQMDIHSESGSISTKSVYQDVSNFSSDSGHIKLGNLHGSSQVRNETGTVTIDTLDGNLVTTTNTGDISVHITRHNDVALSSSKGNITVKLPESTGTRLELQGQRLDIDERLQVTTDDDDPSKKGQSLKGVMGNSEGKLVKATTEQGVVHLQCQSWFDTLQLSKQ